MTSKPYLGFLVLLGIVNNLKASPLNKEVRKTSPQVVEKRLKDLVTLYDYSSTLYSKYGPLSFWSTFAYLASDEEIHRLVKASKGYPTLPVISEVTAHSLKVNYENKLLAEIVVTDFDQQVLSLNGRAISVPRGASIEETAKLIEIEMLTKNQSKPAFERFLEEVFLLKTAQALSKNTQNKGFFSKLFGSFSNGLWGQSSKNPIRRNVNPANNNHAVGGALGYEGFAGSSGPPASIPAPPNSTTQYSSTGAKPSRSLLDTLKIPQLDVASSDCTVIFTRHGEKDSGSQLLTGDGWDQAHALSQSMQDFEKRYGVFDYVLHSNEKRSIQTASPFVNHLKNRPQTTIAPNDMQTLLRECHPYVPSTCKAQAAKAAANVKKYCAGKKGAKIFITAHGSLGRHLMQEMAGGALPGGPDCARPYVFTLNASRFTKVYQSQGERLCTN